MNTTVKILVILLACLSIVLGVRLATAGVYRAVKGSGGAERRARTLGSVASNTVNALLAVFFVFAVLGEMGVNIGPLLAGASILGVALGFGAQWLVKDVLSGLFMLIENQFGVGDIINIDDRNVGTVERMTLRTTVLRDAEGRWHYIPNGSVSRVIVLSKEFACAIVDVEVAHGYDPDEAAALLREIGAEMQREMPGMALEPTEAKGVEAIGQSCYVVRTTTKCARSCQWEVAREYRRRVLAGFRRAGMDMPAQRIVVDGGERPQGPQA
jgi:small conductance mechanosensitive channel